MPAKTPIPPAAHRALTELWGEIEHQFESSNVYDVDDLLLALEVMAEDGDEDAAIAREWLSTHRAEYLEGLVAGFEPV